MRHPSHGFGFTLIELLVVIGIIAVLAAMMFPIFAQGREKARQSRCLGNQKQLITSVLLYLQDHEEILPDAQTVWQDLNAEPQQLACPTADRTLSNSYLYNRILSGRCLADLDDPINLGVIADGANGVVEKRHQGQLIRACADGHVERTYKGFSYTVYLWGSNTFGELGLGTLSPYESNPQQLRSLDYVTALSANQFFTLALRADNTVWAWGENVDGELGDGTTIPHTSPAPVVGLTNVKAIAAGQKHALALKSDSTVWAWGDNDNGALGNNRLLVGSTTPVQVSGLSNVIAIAAGAITSFALRQDGTVWAWGGNHLGEVGTEARGTFITAPVHVAGLTNIVAIAAGDLYALALANDGTLWTWGEYPLGQTGGSTLLFTTRPVRVTGLPPIAEFCAGNVHAVVVDNTGALWTWGRNQTGELGDGTFTSRAVPLRVPGITGILCASAGGSFTSLVKQDGTVWGFGRAYEGEMGNGEILPYQLSPVQAKGLRHVEHIFPWESYQSALAWD